MVTGGRHYRGYDVIFRELDAIGPSQVIHGDQTGADTGADVWAVVNGVTFRRVPAQWRGPDGRGPFDPSAGPRRNKLMLEIGRPDLVLAFPGDRGTANMTALAHGAGIRVIEVKK